MFLLITTNPSKQGQTFPLTTITFRVNYDHGNLVSRFGYFLQSYLERNRCGKMTYQVDIFLPDRGDVIRPDISFILNENLSIVKGHIHGVPDLVCEVLSESTRARDLGVKADRYLFNGVKEYWIIDLGAKTLFLWVNQNKKQWGIKGGEILESEILKAFVVRRSEFF